MAEAPIFPELFESVPDALVVVDGSGTIVAANGHADRLFGYAQGHLVGKSVELLVPVSVRDRHRGHRAGYTARPRPRSMGETDQVLIGQRADGRQFPIEIALSPIQGELGPRFLASVRDVSESQRARQTELRARYDALVARLGQMALESPDGSVVLGSVPEFLAEALAVEAVAIVFPRGAAAGLDIRAAFAHDQEWRDALAFHAANLGALPALVGTRESSARIDRGRELLVDQLPPGRQASSVVAPLLDRDRVVGALVVLSSKPHRFGHDAMHLLRSVANLLAALLQRRRTEDQLAHSQRLDAIGQLTGGIAHDFNNLLTVMSGNLQLLEAELEDRPGSLELVTSALRSATLGADLTAKLLAFARKQRLSPRAIEPAPLLREIAGLLGRTLGDAIRLEVACSDLLPAAFADPTQLDSALVNLALNARDAMPDGGALMLSAHERWVTAGHVEPELKPGRYLVFSVADAGIGMDEETLARAIDPFFTTKDLGRGSGMGLSMVYGFAAQSGGNLHITSRVGAGTRVDLYLPARGGAGTVTTGASAPMARSDGQLVLVVEDEDEVRKVAESLLRSIGYRTIAVASAEAALERLGAEPGIQVLFSDVMLGAGIDGRRLAEAAVASHPGLAVLLTSGYEDSAAESGAGTNTHELLRKPYRREQLAAAFERVLSGRPK
ncbi:MAG: PAS domain S-box protein [Arenimonas sp.]